MLLDLLVSQRDVPAASVARLDAEDWHSLMDMANQHRLGPLLHWRLSRELADMPVPEYVRDDCAQHFKATTLRALVVQRELLLVHRLLDQAGIPHIALKGAYLAFHVYPHPGLRPLRDLDILVTRDQAMKAFDLLIQGGYTRIAECSGDAESWIEVSNHFPPLKSPSGQVIVELHTRLTAPEIGEAAGTDLSDESQLWESTITGQLGNETIQFLSSTDLLVHLIHHAVYHHQFDNGPLLLSDIAYLLAEQPIDWPRFWDFAQRGQFVRGCVLSLKLVEHYWGSQAISWPNEANIEMPQVLIDDSAHLMLRNLGLRSSVKLAANWQRRTSLIAKASLLLRKMFPSRAAIGTLYPRSARSFWWFIWYPLKWWRLATFHLPRFIQARRRERLKTEIQKLGELQKWLAQQP